jgi:copper homeostasis protein
MADTSTPLPSPVPILFEACVDSVESARAAVAGGAGRLELCEALVEGGVTPSWGKVLAVVEAVRGGASSSSSPAVPPIPVNVLVRARAGDFVYTEEELDTMERDIRALRSLGPSGGVHGVVVGALTADGEVDESATGRLISAARGDATGSSAAAPLSVTFHRAIDVTRDPLRAFRRCIALGVDRVLSSGHAATAPLGAPLLRAFVEEAEAAAAGDPSQGPLVIVLAGGGVSASNARELALATGVREVHGTARVTLPCHGSYRPERDEDIVYMGGERRNTPEAEYSRKAATRESVAAVVAALRGADEERRAGKG